MRHFKIALILIFVSLIAYMVYAEYKYMPAINRLDRVIDTDPINISSSTPSSPSDSGDIGDFKWDDDYLYIKGTDNKWRRVAISNSGWAGNKIVDSVGNYIVCDSSNIVN